MLKGIVMEMMGKVGLTSATHLAACQSGQHAGMTLNYNVHKYFLASSKFQCTYVCTLCTVSVGTTCVITGCIVLMVQDWEVVAVPERRYVVTGPVRTSM